MFSIIEIPCETKKDAEQILSEAKALLRDYGYVTLVDIFDLSSMPSTWGDRDAVWTNLDEAKVIWNAGEGHWSMILPKRGEKG